VRIPEWLAGMIYLKDPFFWAFISMFALAGSTKSVNGGKLGRYPVFGILTVTVFALGRLLLVLPFFPSLVSKLPGGIGPLAARPLRLVCFLAIPRSRSNRSQLRMSISASFPPAFTGSLGIRFISASCCGVWVGRSCSVRSSASSLFHSGGRVSW
jgi:hypothetical protein